MRLPIPATVIGCACTIFALSGCGPTSTDTPVNSVETTSPTGNVGAPTNASPGQNGIADTASPTQKQASANSSSNQTSNQSDIATSNGSTPGGQNTSNQQGNQTGQTVSNGASSQPTSSGVSGQNDSNGTSGQATSSGQNASGQTTTSPTNYSSGFDTPPNFSNVSTGSLANQLTAKFDSASWNGMGEAALLISPPNSYGLNGQLLVILADKQYSATANSRAIVLDSHAISASFSPDGKWLAVTTQTNSGSVDSPSEQTHFWLMSSDGKRRLDLGDVTNGIQGEWTSAETFTYTDGKSVYRVKPGQIPQMVPLPLHAGARVGVIRYNHVTGSFAIDEVIPDADGNVVDRHDVLALWNPHSGQVQTLLTAAKGDGFELGAWTVDGSKLYFWNDPLHSSSIAADGLKLRTVSIDGQTKSIGTSLVGMDVVKPVSGQSSIVQMGDSRYLFVQKTVELWDGTKLTPLSPATKGSAATTGTSVAGTGSTSGSTAVGNGSATASASVGNGSKVTQVYPTVSPSGELVAFSEGPVLGASATREQTSQWWQQLKLVTVALKTGQRTVISAAGLGVVQPTFTGDGRHVLYLNGSQLDVVALQTGQSSTVNGSSGTSAGSTKNSTGTKTGQAGPTSNSSTDARRTVFEVDPQSAAAYPQWGINLPVELADYHG